MGRWLCLSLLVMLGCESPRTRLVDSLSIVNWYPSGNAPCVPRDTGIWVSFSEPLAVSTVDDQAAILFLGSDEVAISKQYDADTRTIALQPVAELEFGLRYRVEISDAITAESGHSLPATVVSQFRTIPQDGCAEGVDCFVDADCGDDVCSVTSVCVPECAVDADCAGDSCVSGACQSP